MRGSLRVALRIAAREAARAKGRTALVGLMIGLPVLAGSAGAVVLASQEPTAARYATWYLGDEAQAQIRAFEQPFLEQDARGEGWGFSGQRATEPPALEAHEAVLADAVPAADRLVRTVSATAAISSVSAAPTTAVVVTEVPGDEPELDWLAPLAEGTRPSGQGEVALALPWADRLDVGVGDRIIVTPHGADPVEVTVTAVMHRTARGPDVVAEIGTLVLAPQGADVGPSWPEWYVLGPEPVTWDDVVAINDLGSVVVSRAVILDPPPPTPTPPDVPSDTGRLALGLVVAAMALLEAVVLIGPAFAVSARRHERQMALLAASGAAPSTLRQVVLLGGVVTGAVASVVGIVAGVGVAALIRWVVHLRGGVALPDLRVPLELPLLMVLGTAVAAGAAWLPAHRAGRVDVVAALAGRRAVGRGQHRVPVAGLVLVVIGGAAAVLGAVVSHTGVLVLGVLTLEVGLIAASGGLLSLVGRLAPRFGTAGRLAVRDAIRQRARTAPAVAAVIAAIAGAVTGAVYTQSSEQKDANLYNPLTAHGQVAVGWDNGPLRAGDAPDYVAAVEAVEAALPVTQVQPVKVVELGRAADGGDLHLTAARPSATTCPLFGPSAETLSTDEQNAAFSDPRCVGQSGGQILWSGAESWSTTLVDDGTVIGSLGLPGSDAAADALRQGKVLVPSGYELWPDGTAHLEVTSFTDSADRVVASVVAPAVEGGLPSPQQYGIVLPPDVAEEMGLESSVAGFTVATVVTPTRAEQDAAAAALAREAPGAYLYVERGFTGRQPLVLWVLVGLAAVVGLGATGLAVALTAAESRPDLATLAAVGGGPGLRRRFAAAQAAVVAGLGVGVGVLTGLALGRILVLAERYRFEPADIGWQVVTPWPAVLVVALGVPLLAVGGAFLLTPPRLPMVRRVVG